MDNDSAPGLRGLTIPAGILLFLVVNLFVGVASNPLFPNQAGPMPGWVPYFVLAVVAALVAAAVLRARWRRVAAGFAIGYIGATLATGGGLTTSFSLALTRLDPTREARRAARIEAKHAAEWKRERPRRVAETLSPEGRGYLARTMADAADCAFAYREAMPGDGFPRSLAEVGMGGGMCSRFARPDNSGRLEVLPPPDAGARPATRLRMRLRPPAYLGIAHPLYEVDERGIVTVRDTSTDAPRVVASPVPALLELRRCLLVAVPSRYRTDSLSLLGLLAASDSACAVLHSQTHRNDTTMELEVRIDSRIAAEDDPTGALYLVRYAPLRSRPSEGFALLASAASPQGSRRRYLVTPDGRVHATTEARDATDADPPPAACEMDPRVACD